jgi:diaminopimelate epimerase
MDRVGEVAYIAYSAMDRIPFIKMHGLGNDFVVLDARKQPIAINDEAARAIADRRRGVGCDQVIVLEPPRNASAHIFMRIRNADGGEVEACGNAARCVGDLVMQEEQSTRAVIETAAGLLQAEACGGKRVSVDIGEARRGWREIPLAVECDTLHVPLALGPLTDPVATSMGNPHVTFFVAEAETIDLAQLGPALEHHPIFPERANIGVAQILSPSKIRLRVWERGAGLTSACGTGACAALVAAHRRGLTGHEAELILDGGILEIAWREDGHVTMTGPTALSFTGFLDRSLFA